MWEMGLFISTGKRLNSLVGLNFKRKEGKVKKKKIYLTKEVARMLGITKMWLYALEKRKIFPKAKRDPISNYRYYTESDLKRLKRIRKKR